jgi:chorismate mutase / prephenate dehydratase
VNINELRKQIDDIDEHIVELIASRLKIAQEAGKEKENNGLPIEDRKREEKVMEHVKELAGKEGINGNDIKEVYKQILTVTRNIQGFEVAFQGEEGAYAQEAAHKFFGQSVRTRPCEALDEVFKLVQDNKVPYGIVPVENSQVGSISRSYDLLLESDVTVCGEIQIRVSHSLIANKSASLGSIKKIYSHPQALDQCQAFLKHLGCELIPTYNTAASVKMIKEKKIMDGAAVASDSSAFIYDMKVIAREIEDNRRNSTRFFILGKQDAAPTGEDKTSIVFLLKHEPGTLYKTIGEFATRNINLTKIESRPTKQTPWEYNFYIDFEGHRQDKAISEAITGLKNSTLFLKVLGSYARAK